jgi:hypothetical protein
VGSERYGFGRISLLPIKKSGPAAAKYFVKYLAKAHGSSKSIGEERCRLFGTWGTKRWCCSKFSWVSGHIFRKRLRWCATSLGVGNIGDIENLLGRNWWGRLREPLLRVVLPVKHYQVWDRKSGAYIWDDIGFRAYCSDLDLYQDIPTNERKQRLSQFRFYFELGKSWDMSPRKACRFGRCLLERMGLGLQTFLRLGPHHVG